MSDGDPIKVRDPIKFQPRGTQGAYPVGASGPGSSVGRAPLQVAFNRQELNAILNVYGRKVAEGEWRDYAMDFGREAATFAVFRRASEVPLYRIEKCPRLARKQGAYAVLSASGQILKRGHELSRVLQVFDRRMQVVT